jgi:hypothetical protein
METKSQTMVEAEMVSADFGLSAYDEISPVVYKELNVA